MLRYCSTHNAMYDTKSEVCPVCEALEIRVSVIDLIDTESLNIRQIQAVLIACFFNKKVSPVGTNKKFDTKSFTNDVWEKGGEYAFWFNDEEHSTKFITLEEVLL